MFLGPSVCFSARKITQKVMEGFKLYFQELSAMRAGTTEYILGLIQHEACNCPLTRGGNPVGGLHSLSAFFSCLFLTHIIKGAFAAYWLCFYLFNLFIVMLFLCFILFHLHNFGVFLKRSFYLMIYLTSVLLRNKYNFLFPNTLNKTALIRYLVPGLQYLFNRAGSPEGCMYCLCGN